VLDSKVTTSSHAPLHQKEKKVMAPKYVHMLHCIQYLLPGKEQFNSIQLVRYLYHDI